MANALRGASPSGTLWLRHLPVTSGAAEAAAERKKNGEVQSAVTDVHVHVNRHGNIRTNQQPRTRVSQRPWKAHLPSVR